MDGDRIAVLSTELDHVTNFTRSNTFNSDDVLIVISALGLSKPDIEQCEWLLNLPMNMFIVAEPNSIKQIWNYRRLIGLSEHTFVHSMELKDSPYYVHRAILEQHNQLALPMITSWSKMAAINQAIQMNIFNSKAVLYLDLNQPIPSTQHRNSYQMVKKISENVSVDRIRMLNLEQTGDIEIEDLRTHLQYPKLKLSDNLIAGPIDTMKWLIDQFNINLIRCLNIYPIVTGKKMTLYCSSILNLSYLKDEKRFDLYYGDIGSVLGNYMGYQRGFNHILHNIRYCRDRSWKRMVGICHYLIKSMALDAKLFTPMQRIQILDELILSIWYGYGAKHVAKIAGQEIVSLFKSNSTFLNEQLRAHYNRNLSCVALQLL
jgi:hypothetical protein